MGEFEKKNRFFISKTVSIIVNSRVRLTFSELMNLANLSEFFQPTECDIYFLCGFRDSQL